MKVTRSRLGKTGRVSPQEAVARLKELHSKTGVDVESAHIEADRILCEALICLGQKEVVDAWQGVPRVYGTEQAELEVVITDKIVAAGTHYWDVKGHKLVDDGRISEMVEGLLVSSLAPTPKESAQDE